MLSFTRFKLRLVVSVFSLVWPLCPLR